MIFEMRAFTGENKLWNLNIEIELQISPRSGVPCGSADH